MTRLILALALSLPASALAQEMDQEVDAPAPSLSLTSDPAHPIYRFAAYIDPVALFVDGYGLSAVASLGRFATLTTSPFGAKSSGGTLGLELGLHAMPMGRGVHGVGIGAGVGALLMRRDDERAFRVFADVEYMHVLGGMFLGGSLGATVEWNDDGRDVSPRIRVVLGFAFR